MKLALVVALLGGFIFGLIIPEKHLVLAIGCGPILGLMLGGLFCLNHFVLRLVLWFSRLAPLRYARFLDHAAERLFLRKVGGGYIFVHRMLRDYLASLTEPTQP